MDMQYRNNLIPPVLSLIAFLAVFNLFYNVAPYPIAIANIDDVYKFTPAGYTKPDDLPHKIVSKLDTWRGYEVIEYWYYWPYDGYETRADWEPVILLIENGHVKAVAARMHYTWRVSFTFPKEDSKPVVMFNYLWHTPLLREPLYDWVGVKEEPIIGQPPEKVNYDEVFGIGLLPTQSAIASAIIFGTISLVVVYFASSHIVSRRIPA